MRRGGGIVSQISPTFLGQRPAKKQPWKRCLRDGTAPGSRMRVGVASGSGTGTAESNASVYGCDGAVSTHSVGPDSATCPA